jgi:hypothetical protein
MIGVLFRGKFRGGGASANLTSGGNSSESPPTILLAFPSCASTQNPVSSYFRMRQVASSPSITGMHTSCTPTTNAIHP